MGKIIVDKPNTPGIIGPDGAPLTSDLPKNLPEFLIIGVNFVNKITQEPEFATALVFPAREYFTQLKENKNEMELVQLEAIINSFARELYTHDKKTFDELGDAKELHKYMVTNYDIVMTMPILANNILQVNFSDKHAEAEDSLSTEEEAN